jgi:hypothetical protein
VIRAALALLPLAGCAPEAHPMAAIRPDISERVGQAFLDAVARKDAAAIQSALHAPLAYGGLLFADPECTQQFPTATTIAADSLPAFAKCLATLPLRASARHSVLSGVQMVEYEPGIEVDVQYTYGTSSAWVSFIGFAGRHDVADALPTVSPSALEALRIAGDPAGPLDSTTRGAIEVELRDSNTPAALAWLKVCIDATGMVSSIHPREVSSTTALDAFTTVVRGWRFRPFVFAGHPVPVCAVKRFVYPADKARPVELVPLSVDPEPGVPLVVSATALKRISGQTFVAPDDEDKIALQHSTGNAAAALKLCLDESGVPTRVVLLLASGLRRWDAKLVRELQKWRFRPMTSNGKPIPVCTVYSFNYHQR